jgi:hypothetical protein
MAGVPCDLGPDSVRPYEDTCDCLGVACDDFSDIDHIPVDGIIATDTDTGHGWTEREVRDALRATNRRFTDETIGTRRKLPRSKT